jgi:hypothetical protein
MCQRRCGFAGPGPSRTHGGTRAPGGHHVEWPYGRCAAERLADVRNVTALADAFLVMRMVTLYLPLIFVTRDQADSSGAGGVRTRTRIQPCGEAYAWTYGEIIKCSVHVSTARTCSIRAAAATCAAAGKPCASVRSSSQSTFAFGKSVRANRTAGGCGRWYYRDETTAPRPWT